MKTIVELLAECNEFIKENPSEYGLELPINDVKIVAEALEQQVPKKPIWEGPHNQAKDDAIPYCSVCDTELEEDWNGCPDCLTPIDWSVGE